MSFQLEKKTLDKYKFVNLFTDKIIRSEILTIKRNKNHNILEIKLCKKKTYIYYKSRSFNVCEMLRNRN